MSRSASCMDGMAVASSALYFSSFLALVPTPHVVVIMTRPLLLLSSLLSFFGFLTLPRGCSFSRVTSSLSRLVWKWTRAGHGFQPGFVADLAWASMTSKMVTPTRGWCGLMTSIYLLCSFGRSMCAMTARRAHVDYFSSWSTPLGVCLFDIRCGRHSFWLFSFSCFTCDGARAFLHLI
ncbi:hypothetical protein B0H19DRAFT_83128 [Mycena capillaripes]|nr:hypothetical protein B0H19DRAFT_83128 [Mycena capillaripes]